MTWEPRYIVHKAPHVGGDPIPDDEPCLVIRAQDILAVPVLESYLTFYKALAGFAEDELVVEELDRHLDRLRQWQNDHGDELKWADR